MNEISNWWPQPELFYAERDHRTKLSIAAIERYANVPIEIFVDPEEAASASVQLIAVLAANITSRWARNVRVYVPDVSIHPRLQREHFILFKDRIISEMRAADPFGRFEAVEPDAPRVDQSLRLFIGPWHGDKRSLSSNDYLVHATQWSVIGQRGHSLDFDASVEASVAASGLAAAIGVGDLFKRAVDHPKEHWIPNFCWNLGTHQLISDKSSQRRITMTDVDSRAVTYKMNVGKTLIAGVGAIGSALIYLLDTLELEGSLTVLDRDRVELSNLNRSPLFTVRHALKREIKTTVVADYLRTLRVDKLDGTWREHSDSLWEREWDTWVSFTNEDAAWAELPFTLPPVVLQGTTTSGWGIGAGRHIPKIEDCTLCRMPRPEAQFRGPCSEGQIEIDESGTELRASLPFLSVAASALVLAEFERLSSGVVLQTSNDISADFQYGLPAVLALKRKYNQNCRGCRAAQIPLWKLRGGTSCYTFLSMG